MVVGARAVISFCIRSAMPGYMVVPPDSTVLAYRSLRMSTSHFMMLLKDFHEVVSEVSASQVQPEDGMGQSIALVDGHCVGHAITGVHDDTSGTTRGVQGQHSLDGHIHGWVQRSLSQQHRVLLRGNSQLIVEVGHNTVLNGVLQGEDSPFALCLITNITVFLAHTNHHTLGRQNGKSYLMPGAANNGGKDSTWSIISCKASFAHTGSVVNNEGGNFVNLCDPPVVRNPIRLRLRRCCQSKREKLSTQADLKAANRLTLTHTVKHSLGEFCGKPVAEEVGTESSEWVPLANYRQIGGDVPAAGLVHFGLDQNGTITSHSHKGQNANNRHQDWWLAWMVCADAVVVAVVKAANRGAAVVSGARFLWSCSPAPDSQELREAWGSLQSLSSLPDPGCGVLLQTGSRSRPGVIHNYLKQQLNGLH
ncbi:unnamed protein product [Menidia menidia]|uniref:(Atlantic silverside) hypothetical protein n=1 Tax=Menidia menidia TaxID=238744 RepID=A0A8S4B986_9TELE|nr:unnamed protein product [Menidia menidia]